METAESLHERQTARDIYDVMGQITQGARAHLGASVLLKVAVE